MEIFDELVSILIDKNLTVSCAESCTGGLFSSNIVSVTNASKVLSSAFITYSEDAKIKLVQVNKDSITNYGVVSEQVAVEMAVGAAKMSQADVAVGITGYAGPATDKNDDTAGRVCFGFYVNGKTVSSKKEFGDIGRNAVRELAVIYAAKTLISLIKRFGDIK